MAEGDSLPILPFLSCLLAQASNQVVTSHQFPSAAESKLWESGRSAATLPPIEVLTAPHLQSFSWTLMDLPNLCWTPKSSPKAEKRMHCPAPNINPLVLPHAKAPMLFGDYMLFLKGANLMPQTTLFRKLCPSSLISFPFPPGNIRYVMGSAPITISNHPYGRDNLCSANT